MRRIGDQHGPTGRAADDDQFRRLNKYLDVAVLHQIPAEHAAEDY